jgi:hypothetical protein
MFGAGERWQTLDATARRSGYRQISAENRNFVRAIAVAILVSVNFNARRTTRASAEVASPDGEAVIA